jgi:hypothetical protein
VFDHPTCLVDGCKYARDARGRCREHAPLAPTDSIRPAWAVDLDDAPRRVLAFNCLPHGIVAVRSVTDAMIAHHKYPAWLGRVVSAVAAEHAEVAKCDARRNLMVVLR